MRILFLLSILGLCSYFAHDYWFAAEPAPPPPPPPPVAKKVSLGVKKSVRGLFDEWKRRQLKPHLQSATAIDPESELAQIRSALFSAGQFSEEALQAAVSSALIELGVSQDEVGKLAGEIVALRSEHPGKRSTADLDSRAAR